MCHSRRVWQSDLAALRERVGAVDVDAEVSAARELVGVWRVGAGGWTFLHPAPLIVRATVALEGAWAPRDEPVFGDVLVGLDDGGRPLLVLENSGIGVWDRPVALFVWSADGFDEVDLSYRDARHHRYRVVDDRVVHRVSVESESCEVALVSCSGGRAVRADIASACGYVGVSAAARTASFGDDEPLVVRRGYVRVAERDDDSSADALAGDSATAALAAALPHAASLHPVEIEWDGRISPPTPLPADPSALVEDLAVALADAIAAAVTDAAALEPFCVEVRERHDRPLLPPVIHIAGRAFRDRMREASGDDMQAIMVIAERAAGGDVVSEDLIDRLDDRALEACRALSSAARPRAAPADVDGLVAIVRGLGDRLAELLCARSWPQTTDPFLALVRLCYLGDDGLALAIRRAVDSAGREHVERFLQSVSSTAPRRGLEELAAQVTAARKDRAVLAEILREHGLPAHADRLAFDCARVGLQVLTAGDDAGVLSRLGGPPLLPAGCAWPHHGPGRPLSFLAGLNLAEIRAAGGDDRLPDDGWLLFFADLDTGDCEGLVDYSDNDDDAPARVLHVPAGQAPVETQSPAALLLERPELVLNARRVRFDSCLTLSSDYELPERLGLDGYEAESWEEVTEVLLSGRPLMSTQDWRANIVDELLSQAAAEDSWHGGRIYDDDDADAIGIDETVDDACSWEGDEAADCGLAADPQHDQASGYLVDVFFIGEPGDQDADSSAIRAALSEYMASGEALIGEPDTDDEDVDWPPEGDGMLRSMSEAPAGSTFFASHWVGGLQTGVQGHPTDDDTELLLHIADDAELGFHFLDAGAIQFRIPTAALAAHDWSQITATADSC